eukprot:CAMPEP_0118665108 /NCGR_PEP_ID=MMETSP0785-20121206/18424_1 /TAXON_ID=91992 /ORGANISM="Bolidomonas pacifica, Strain CCMP 1866" /LENGTH=107 /DNA_ID=CAMNT_0006559167 /DNA_START=132 /DNA_END=452 /DNA_ORIENTATION=+
MNNAHTHHKTPPQLLSRVASLLSSAPQDCVEIVDYWSTLQSQNDIRENLAAFLGEDKNTKAFIEDYVRWRREGGKWEELGNINGVKDSVKGSVKEEKKMNPQSSMNP